MATGDGLSQQKRNEEIGVCAAHIRMALHKHSEERGLTSMDQLLVLLKVIQEVVFMMREFNATTR